MISKTVYKCILFILAFIIIGIIAIWTAVYMRNPLYNRLKGLELPQHAQGPGSFVAESWTSSTVDVKIPAKPSQILAAIDSFDDSGGLIHLTGWGLIPGIDSIDQDIYLVLQNEKNTFVYQTAGLPMRDITIIIGKGKVNYDRSGFRAVIDKAAIEPGQYYLGLLIEQKNKDKKTVHFRMMAESINYEPGKAVTLERRDYQNTAVTRINYALENFVEEENSFTVSGWAVIPDMDADKNKVYFSLENKESFYIFETKMVDRPSVTKYIGKNRVDYDNSGFVLTTGKDAIEPGEYHVGIYIVRDTGKKSIHTYEVFKRKVYVFSELDTGKKRVVLE